MAVTDRPSLVVVRTHIGHPSPDLTDRHEAHGNPFTAELTSRTKQAMGIPDEPFWSPDDLVTAYRGHCAERGAEVGRVEYPDVGAADARGWGGPVVLWGRQAWPAAAPGQVLRVDGGLTLFA